MSETPDLLRRPGHNLQTDENLAQLHMSQSACPLLQLHQRARKACLIHRSQVKLFKNFCFNPPILLKQI